MASPLRAAVALAALVAVASTASAAAQPPPPDGHISACYGLRTGALRLVDGARPTCRRGQAPLRFDLAGAAGARGPVGERGARGPAGATGAAGPVGPRGPGAEVFTLIRANVGGQFVIGSLPGGAYAVSGVVAVTCPAAPAATVRVAIENVSAGTPVAAGTAACTAGGGVVQVRIAPARLVLAEGQQALLEALHQNGAPVAMAPRLVFSPTVAV